MNQYLESARTHRLALGTVQFGLPYGIANTTGQVSPAEAERMVSLAADNGIDTIDTAIGYGESEQVLGRIGMQGFKVVSKIPPVPPGVTNVREWVRDEVARSLDTLRIDRLYGLLLHRSADLFGPYGDVLAEALCELKAEGAVAKTGVSIYSPDDLNALSRKLKLDLIQAPFNLADRRLHSSGWLQRLKSEGAEVHVRSVFLQGLLLMPREAMPPKFAHWAPLFDRWHDWQRCHEASAVAACLAFPLSFPAIDRVVVGANDLAQLQEILHAAAQVVETVLPDLACVEEDLINPARWPTL